MPNPRWDDDALDQRFKLVDRITGDHDNQLTAMSALPSEMARMARGVEALAAELRDFKEDVRDDLKRIEAGQEKRIDHVHKRIDEITGDRRGRWQSRALIIAASIGGIASLLVGILNVIVALQGHP